MALVVAIGANAAAQGGSVSPRVELSFVTDLRPAIAAGLEWRTPLGAPPPLPTGQGPIIVAARPWSVSAMLTAGLSFARPRDEFVTPTLHAEIGVLHRVAGGNERLGPFVFGALRPDVLGPVIRYEPLDPVGVEFGWLWSLNHRANGLVVSGDVSWALLYDVFGHDH